MKMSALYRQWLILKILPTRTNISTTELHERLVNNYEIKVTHRTVQRDLKDLVDKYKFPIITDEKNPAGWSWSKDSAVFGIYNLDPLTVLTFKLAEKHLERMFPRGAVTALEPYFKAANDRIKLSSNSSLSRWPNKIRVVSRNLPLINPQISDDILDKVYTAVLEEHRFHTRYRTIGGKIKEYDVNPLGMAFVEGLTYIVATLNEHEDPVLLLLHRILEITPTNILVKVPKGFDLDVYTSNELSFPVGDDIKLKALFSNKVDIERLRETPISTDQKITEKDGGWQLDATVSDSYQLRWWLHGYVERVEVLEPAGLRQEFAETAKKLSALYQ
jgi:predicted DNA-binding transcriptional regulator YafY